MARRMTADEGLISCRNWEGREGERDRGISHGITRVGQVDAKEGREMLWPAILLYLCKESASWTQRMRGKSYIDSREPDGVVLMMFASNLSVHPCRRIHGLVFAPYLQAYCWQATFCMRCRRNMRRIMYWTAWCCGCLIDPTELRFFDASSRAAAYFTNIPYPMGLSCIRCRATY